MRQTGEQLNNGSEGRGNSFNGLVERVLPLAERLIISKLSATTSGETYDKLIYKYETPVLEVVLGEDTSQVKLAVYSEDHLDPISRELVDPPVYGEIQISFTGQSAAAEGKSLKWSNEVYSGGSLDAEKVTQLAEIVESYEIAAKNLSPEDAETRGFSSEAIQFLSES